MVDINYILSFSSVKLDRHYTYGYILPSTFFDKKNSSLNFLVEGRINKAVRIN